MEGLLSAFIFLFICMSVWAFTTWRKIKNMENLKEWVAWSICDNDGVRWNIPLWAHLKNAQIRNVPEKYRIVGDQEWGYAKEIIERYKENLTNSYFNGHLLALKSLYGIDGKDYFIFMLYVYLCEHEMSSHNVVYHKMHYISYMYCKENLALQKYVPAWNEERLTEILDSHLPKAQPEPYRRPSIDGPDVKINYRGRP